MPKNKAWGENPKAQEARLRKASAKAEADEKKAKANEDAYWQDDDKSAKAKQNRKEEQEKKRLEKSQRKQESKQLERDESDQIVKSSQAQNPIKVTQTQIAAERERREAAARKASTAATKAPKPAPLVENLNRELPVEEATTVDEALKMLSVNETSTTPDRHPERRAKAAYKAFEEVRLPQLKAENPSLRLSQLKQMLFEEWKKSPENPMNQEHEQYNA